MKSRIIFTLLLSLGCLVVYSAPERELKQNYSVSIDDGSGLVSDDLLVYSQVAMLPNSIFIDKCTNEFQKVNLNLPSNPALTARFTAYKPRSTFR